MANKTVSFHLILAHNYTIKENADYSANPAFPEQIARIEHLSLLLIFCLHYTHSTHTHVRRRCSVDASTLIKLLMASPSLPLSPFLSLSLSN